MRAGRGFRVTATGVAFDSGNANVESVMVGARLFGGSAASSAVIRQNDGSGTILAELQCAAGGADECRIPVLFKGALHVTLAGTGAAAMVYV